MPRKVFLSPELIAYYWSLHPRLLTKVCPVGFLETDTLDGKGRTPAKGDIFSKNPALANTRCV